MFFSLSHIIQLILAYRYIILFPFAIIEGPIITVIAGFVASLGQLNLLIAYIIIIIGDLAADSLYYALGYWGREGVIKKWGKYVGVTVERMEKVESHFSKHSGKTLVAGKLSQGVGVVILVAAGISKMPFGRFVWINFFATLPKTLLLLLAGYYFGRTYVEWNRYLSYTTLITVGLAVFFVAVYFTIKKIARKYE